MRCAGVSTPLTCRHCVITVDGLVDGTGRPLVLSAGRWRLECLVDVVVGRLRAPAAALTLTTSTSSSAAVLSTSVLLVPILLLVSVTVDGGGTVWRGDAATLERRRQTA